MLWFFLACQTVAPVPWTHEPTNDLEVAATLEDPKLAPFTYSGAVFAPRIRRSHGNAELWLRVVSAREQDIPLRRATLTGEGGEKKIQLRERAAIRTPLSSRFTGEIKLTELPFSELEGLAGTGPLTVSVDLATTQLTFAMPSL